MTDFIIGDFEFFDVRANSKEIKIGELVGREFYNFKRVGMRRIEDCETISVSCDLFDIDHLLKRFN